MLFDRAHRAGEILEKHGLDAMLFTDMHNIRYLTGFTGSDGVLVMTMDRSVFLTDSRYVTQAGQQVSCERVEYQQKNTGIVDFLNQTIAAGQIGFESAVMTVDMFNELQSKCENALHFVAVPNTAAIRSVKDDIELAKISRAADISRDALESILERIRPGVTELDVAIELELAARRLGSETRAFEFIVASGTRGAMPHGVASAKKIASGDMVTIDFGSRYDGYFSDETVNFAVGDIDPKLSDIHKIVQEAHDQAMAAVKPGVCLAEIDRIARDFITKKGYGSNFGHGLGHGVGLEIHEPPRVASSSDVLAEVGMVFTIEPGIYVPGLGGVRIEDIVVVTEQGCRCLTSLPKQLRRLSS